MFSGGSVMRAALIAIIVTVTVSCTPAGATTDEELYPVAAQLTKLAAAIDSFVATTPEAGSLSEQEVLRRSAARDPSLLREFNRYVLRLRVEGRNSAVLVCSSDRSQAYIEDAGCSARSDAHHWRAAVPRPCEFTLNLREICGP